MLPSEGLRDARLDLREETGERKLETTAARTRCVMAMAFASASEQEGGRQGALPVARRWVEEKGGRDRVEVWDSV
jgi:hypothetical protein